MSIGLTDKIAPLGSFAITEDTDTLGGLRVVADATERNAIPTLRRKPGMIVVQENDPDNWYQLAISPWVGTDADWIVLPQGASASSGFSVQTGATPSGSLYATWTSMVPDLLAATGFRQVLVDNHGSTNVATVQDAASNFDGQVEVIGINRTRGTMNLGGKSLRNIRAFRSVTLNLASGQNSAILQGPLTSESVPYSGNLTLRDVTIVNSSTNALIGPARVGAGPYSYTAYRLTLDGQFSLTGLLWEVSPGTTSELYVGSEVTVPANSIVGDNTTTLNVFVAPGGKINSQASSFLGTLNVFTLGISGIQYQGSHVTTRKEVNFNGLVTVSDDFANDRINVDITGSVFIFNPQGTAGGNVYTTWANVWAAAGVAKGSRTILVDGTGATVPSGTYQCDDLVDFVGIQREQTAPYTTVLTFSSGAVLRNVRSVKNLALSYTTTPIVNGQASDAPTNCNGTIALENVDLQCSSAVVAIGFPSATPNSGQNRMKVFLAGYLTFRSSARLLSLSADPTTREIYIGEGITIPTGAILGGSSGPNSTTNIFLSPGATLGTQAALIGTINLTTYARSAVQNSGTTVGARHFVNFSGSAVTSVSDDPTNDRVNVVLSKDGGAGALSVQEEGVGVSSQPTMNFIGVSVTAVDDPGNSRVNVTVDPLLTFRPTGTGGGSDFLAKLVTFSSDYSNSNIAITNPTANQVNLNITPRMPFMKNAAVVSTRPQINFIGFGVSVADNSGGNRTDITIDPPTVLDEGVFVGAVLPTFNFKGAGVTAAYDVLNNWISIDVPGSGSISVLDEGASITSAISSLNFIGGGVTAVYNSGASRVDVTVPGSASISVQDEGSAVTSALSVLNFIGPGVTAALSTGVVNVTIPGNVAVQKNGTGVAAYPTINFTGQGIGTFTDDFANSRVNIDIPGLQVLEEGTNAGSPVPKLNFIGPNITAVYDSGNNRVNVTVGTGAGTIDVQDEGTGVATRGTINFIGAGVTAADDSGNGRVNVTIPGTYPTIQDEGSALTVRTTLNFIGIGVTAADDAGNTRTNITIPTKIVMVNGVTETDRATIHFTGDGVSGLDDSLNGRTLVRIDGKPILTEGSATPYRLNLNFIGGGVSVGDDAGGDKTDITIPGTGAQSQGTSTGVVRPVFNFKGEGISAVDNPGNTRVDVTVAGLTVMDEGSAVGTHSTINFIGAAITAVDNPGASRVDVTVTASGATLDVQDEGSLAGSEPTLNFIGAGVTAVDDSGNARVNVTIPGLQVQDEGSNLTFRSRLNFIGAGVTAVDDSGNTRTNVTIPGIAFQDEGSALTTQPATVNFTGAGVTASFASSTVTVNIPGTVSLPFYDEGTLVNSANSINFVGVGVTATYDSPNTRAVITIPGLTVLDETTSLGAASVINFTGSGVTAALDIPNNRINVTVGGAGSLAFQDEGSAVASRGTANFVGSGVTVTDDVINDAVIITIPGAGAAAGLSGDAGVNRHQSHVGDLRPVLSGWSQESNNIGKSSPFAQYDGVPYIAVGNEVDESVVVLQIDAFTGGQNSILLFFGFEAPTDFATCKIIDSTYDATFVVVTTGSVNFMKFRQFSQVDGGLGLDTSGSPVLLTAGDGTGGRLAVVDDSPTTKIVWITMPGSNTLAWYSANDPSGSAGTEDPGLGTSIVALTYSPNYGLIFSTATAIYSVSVSGNTLGTPALIASIAGIVDLKFDGERILAVKVGELYALNPATGSTLWSITGDARLTAKSRLTLTAEGLFMVSGEFTDGGLSIRNYQGEEISEAIATSPGTNPYSVSGLLVDAGQMVFTRHSDNTPSTINDTGTLVNDALILGFGQTSPQWRSTTGTNVQTGAIGPVAIGATVPDGRVRHVGLKIDVVTSTAPGSTFTINWYRIDLSSVLHLIATTNFTETTTGQFFLDDATVTEVVVAGESVGYEILPPGVVATDWNVYAGASYEVAVPGATNATVTTLPYTTSTFSISNDPGFVNQLFVNLDVNTVLNGTDTIRATLKKGVTVVTTADFVEASGPIYFESVTPVGDAFGGSADLYTIEIDNVTNPGSSADWSNVTPQVYWSASTIAFPGGTIFATHTINEIEFKYKALTSGGTTFNFKTYKNGFPTNTHGYTEATGAHTVTFTPSPLTSTAFADAFTFRFESTALFETWRIAWDADGTLGSPLFTWALRKVYAATTKIDICTGVTAVNRHNIIAADKIVLKSVGNSGYLYSNSGRVGLSNLTQVATVSNNYNLTALITSIYADTATASTAFTVDLTNGFAVTVATGTRVLVKDISGSASTKNVTITSGGVLLIGAATTYTLDDDNGEVLLEWTGSKWVIILSSKNLVSGVTTQDEGSDIQVGSQKVNFVGAGVAATYDSGNNRTNVTIEGIAVQEEGTTVGTRAIVNFIGATVTAVDNPGSSRVDVTVTAGSGSLEGDSGNDIASFTSGSLYFPTTFNGTAIYPGRVAGKVSVLDGFAFFAISDAGGGSLRGVDPLTRQDTTIYATTDPTVVDCVVTRTAQGKFFAVITTATTVEYVAFEASTPTPLTFNTNYSGAVPTATGNTIVIVDEATIGFPSDKIIWTTIPGNTTDLQYIPVSTLTAGSTAHAVGSDISGPMIHVNGLGLVVATATSIHQVLTSGTTITGTSLITNFSGITALAFDGERILAANGSTGEVKAFTPGGNFLWTFTDVRVTAKSKISCNGTGTLLVSAADISNVDNTVGLYLDGKTGRLVWCSNSSGYIFTDMVGALGDGGTPAYVGEFDNAGTPSVVVLYQDFAEQGRNDRGTVVANRIQLIGSSAALPFTEGTVYRDLYGVLQVRQNRVNFTASSNVSADVEVNKAVLMDTVTAGAGTTVNLVPPTSYEDILIKDTTGSASTNNIVISSSGYQIDGAADYTINVDRGAVTIRWVPELTTWIVASKY